MKYFDSFSGIGGFTIPLEEAGCECVGFSETDKYSTSVYLKHFNHKQFGDITKIKTEELPDFDLLVCGSPCQDLSVAGKQKGLAGNKSGLFFHFIRLLKEKQPRYFIFENVKGALSSSKGWDFARMQIEFSEAGYDFQWQVLNSKDFGVPQNRQRLFVVGYLGKESSPEIFPFGEADPSDLREVGKDVSYKKRRQLIQINNPRHSNNRVYDPEGISPTLNTMQGGNRQPLISNTVRCGGQNSTFGSRQCWDKYLINGRIRRLTPLECEKLQGFSPNWTKEGINENGEIINISDSRRYKMAGNAVTVNVVREIVKRLINN